MKEIRTHSIRPTLRGLVLGLAVLALSSQVVRATPFASCITNVGNTITFYLNESGGNVTITYDGGGPGKTNANYNGVTSGMNLAAGPYTFDLTGHTTYSISVYKVGSGTASTITSISRGSGRGVAANTRGASPYFGYVYSVISGSGTVMQHPYGGDTTTLNGAGLKPPISGGISWGSGASSEYFVSVAPDDSVLVSDFYGAGGTWPYSTGVEGGVIRVDPTFTTAQLLLNGLTGLSSPAAPGENHGVAESRAILSDVLANNPTLYVIDGSAFSPWNQIVVYSNLTSASLPWANQPDVISPPTGPAGAQGSGAAGVLRAGLALGTNGYLYVSQDRANLSNPNFQVWNAKALNSANASALATAMATTDATRWPSTPIIATNLLWSSYWFATNGATITTNDYTVTGTPALPEPGYGPSELALSPDNRYIALVHDDNHITIFTLTNGIPDLASEYLIKGLLGQSTFGRGICWDAAGNLWLASSAYSVVLQVSVGRTATAITSGNASGPTGFQVVSPTEVDVTQLNPSVPFASQANSYGNHTSVTNVITRIGNVASPLRVFFTFGGTAAAGTYTTSATNSILLVAGQTSSNIVITAVNGSVALPTTTVVLTIGADPSGQYIAGFQNAVTDYIVNTATPQLVVGAAAGTMYKAFSNDFTSVTITRWGDTNTAFTTTGFTYGGSAGIADYAKLSSTVTFNKGDVTKTVNIAKPLIGGLPPVDSTSITYTGNKTIVVAPTAGSGYVSYSSNNTATLTILDSAYPAATVLWLDPLTAPLGGVNGNDDGSGQWNITPVDSDDGVVSPDYNADFGLDLTTGGSWGAAGMVPLPPSGATTVLRVTANKIHGGVDTVAVNLYPTNVTFSGDYAVRFNMFMNQGGGFSSAEGPFFGINHSGTLTNWWFSAGTINGGPWAADGVFYWLDNWAAGPNSPADYQEFTGSSTNAGWVRLAEDSYASYLNVYKTALYTSCNSSSNLVGGLPANNVYVIPTPIGQWADVEIKQVQNVVTMSINHTPIFSYANTNSAYTTVSTSGCLMLGYETPGPSGANSTEAAAYFSNLQVVRIGQTTITILPNTATSGGNITIQFTSSNGADTTSSFVLQSSATVNGTYTDVSPAATFTQNGSVFQTVYPQNGPARFYRIRHK